ncbi:High affinity Ca2+/Mn2+ P-type ATPase-like protein, partial [Ascosphaera atra]
MARDGLRVIAFASGSVRDSSSALNRGPTSRVSTPDKYGRATPPAQTAAGKKEESNERYYNGLVFSGLVGMSDPPRKDVHKSIRQLMAGGVKVIMITGDAEQTATAIGAKLGMPINYASSASTSHAGNKAVLRGDEIEHMSTTELAQRIAGTSIFARTSPEHKMKIVRALQSRGDVVAMTGDGVNDAPALKKADIGISMGRLGTDVAKEASDMILTDDDFSTILRAIEQGKSIFYNIQNFITFQLSTSVAALSLVL